jgi:hypothetical protein
MRTARTILLDGFLLLAASPGCGGGGGQDGGTDVDAVDVVDTVDTASDVEEEAEFAVTSCNPYHGPFVGGQEVVVRGRGFDDGIEVTFGDALVQPADITVEDIHRITVVTPAGEPGPVEVCVTLGGERTCKADAYVYDDFYVDPPRGSIAGGTYVTITGADTDFDPGADVTFDGRPATEIDVVSETSITCRTPEGTVGPANVEITGSDPYSP